MMTTITSSWAASLISWLASAVAVLAGLFSRTADADSAPADRLVGIDRETERLRTEQARLTQRVSEIDRELLDVERASEPLAFEAEINRSAAAATALDAQEATRQKLDVEKRRCAGALKKAGERLSELDDKRAEATRAQNIDCVRQLIVEQTAIAEQIDRELPLVAAKIRQWIETDWIISHHVTGLGIAPGRGVEGRLADALNGLLYPSMMPPLWQQQAADISLNTTTARRGGTFTALSASKGPASSIVRAPVPEES